MKTALCIPSYGHRHTELLEHMNKYTGDKYDMFVFIQDNDVNNKLYYDDNFENVRVIQTEARALCENRQQIVNFCMDSGYKKIIMCDDDMGDTVGMIDASCKRATSDSYKKKTVDIFELFDKMVSVADEYDAGLVGVPHDVYLGFMKPGKVTINSGCSVCGIVLIDLDKTFRLYPELHYTTPETNISEDIDIALQMRQNNVKFAKICDYGYNTYKAFGKSVCFEDSRARDINVFNTAKKWRLQLKTDRDFHLQLKARWNLYENHTMPEPKNDLEKKLFKMYDDNVPFEEVYEYVKSLDKKYKKKEETNP